MDLAGDLDGDLERLGDPDAFDFGEPDRERDGDRDTERERERDRDRDRERDRDFEDFRDPADDLDLDLETDRETDLDLDLDRDLDLDLDLDREADRDRPPSDEDEPMRLRLVAVPPSSSLSPPLAILSFSVSLSSSDDETMALETIFFFCLAESPSSCSFISLRRLARSAFFLCLLLIFFSRLRLLCSPDFLPSASPPGPASPSLPDDDTISPSSRFRPRAKKSKVIFDLSTNSDPSSYTSWRACRRSPR